MGENETRFLSLSGQGFQLIRGTVMAEKKEFIRIRGARENNLKALNVDIPRNQFVVFTGLSGSGKSSLAFDTIYAEGQRRYMESLSSYARQFLGQMEKPNVDSIEGLPPAISIDQKSTNRNPRSTVGTVTEIYDYFRLLYARIGIPHCPKCGQADGISLADGSTTSKRRPSAFPFRILFTENLTFCPGTPFFTTTHLSSSGR